MFIREDQEKDTVGQEFEELKIKRKRTCIKPLSVRNCHSDDSSSSDTDCGDIDTHDDEDDSDEKENEVAPKRSKSANGTKRHSKTMSVSDKRKKAQAVAGQALLGDSLTDDDLTSLSSAKLIMEIKRLRKELEQEKARKKLRDELPTLLVEAMSSPCVIKKLRCFQGNTPSCQPQKLERRFSGPPMQSLTQKADSETNVPEPVSPSINSPSESKTPTSELHTPRTPTIFTPTTSSTSAASHAPPKGNTPKTPGPVLTDFDKSHVHELLTPSAVAEVQRSKNYSKMTKTLLTALFGRDVLSKASLSEKSESGVLLDKIKVEMITAYVTQSFPFATRVAIRQAMSQKIKDEKKACERKEKAEKL